MKIDKKIGIVGKGFVGTAVQFGFSPSVGVDADVKVYDKDQNKSTHTLQEVVVESDIIFLSVPTADLIAAIMTMLWLRFTFKQFGERNESTVQLK